MSNAGSCGRGAYFAHSVNYSSNGYQHVVPASYQVHQSYEVEGGYGKSSKKRKGYVVSTSSAIVPGMIGNSGFGAVGGGFGGGYGTTMFPTSYSNTTTVSESVMKFPPGVGIGDAQLILARVCVGKTSNGGNAVCYFILFPFLPIVISFLFFDACCFVFPPRH